MGSADGVNFSITGGKQLKKNVQLAVKWTWFHEKSNKFL